MGVVTKEDNTLMKNRVVILRIRRLVEML